MNHSVFAGSKFHKCAEVQNSHNFSCEFIAHFGVFGNGKHQFLCLFRHLLVGCGNKHRAVVGDVDFDACFVDNLVDNLSAAADNLTDFVGVDVEGNNLWCVLGKFRTRCGKNLQHFVQNVQSALTSLFQSGTQNVFVDTLYFDVHLNGGYSLCRTCNFEVHVSKKVFKSLNIRQNCHLGAVFRLHKSHCDTCNGRLDGNACIHKRQRGTANACLRRTAVTAYHFRNGTDCIGEFRLAGDYRFQSTFRKCAVAYFTSAGTAQRLCLACRIAGHVVLVHVSLVGVGVVEVFQLLHFGNCSQSCRRYYLRHSTGKHAAAVHTGKDSRFAPDGTDFREFSAVGTHAFVEDSCTHLFFGHLVQNVAYIGNHVGVHLFKVFHNLSFHFVLICLTFVSVERFERFGEHFVGIGTHNFFVLLAGKVQFDLRLGFAHFLTDEFDEFALFLYCLVSEHDGVKHFLFGYFVCACFHHHYGVLGSRKVEVEQTAFLLFLRGVDDVLAVNVAHNDASRRSCKGNVGNGKSNGTAHHCVHFRLNVRFHRHCRGNYRHVVQKSLGEQRTDGSVDKTRSQNSLVACSAFTFFESAWNFTHGIHFFFKINAQREKVYSVTGLFCQSYVGHNNGVAALYHAGTVCLFGVLAYFHTDCSTTNFHFENVVRSIANLSVNFSEFLHFSVSPCLFSIRKTTHVALRQ